MFNNFISSLVQPDKIFWLIGTGIICIVVYKIFIKTATLFSKLAELYTNFVEILHSKSLIRYAAIVFISLFVAFWQTSGKDNKNNMQKIKGDKQNVLVKLVNETIEEAKLDVSSTTKK